MRIRRAGEWAAEILRCTFVGLGDRTAGYVRRMFTSLTNEGFCGSHEEEYYSYRLRLSPNFNVFSCAHFESRA